MPYYTAELVVACNFIFANFTSYFITGQCENLPPRNIVALVVWTGENDTKTISVDADLFENGAPFSFENVLVWTGL